ncbi:hypothetical protein HN873_024416 [Arachis hypogaea]
MKSNVNDPSDFDKVLKCRLGVLGTECSRLMDVACKNSSDFIEAMNDIVNTITKLQKVRELPRKTQNLSNRESVQTAKKNNSSHLDMLTKWMISALIWKGPEFKPKLSPIISCPLTEAEKKHVETNNKYIFKVTDPTLNYN